jgi:hypothetical protein
MKIGDRVAAIDDDISGVVKTLENNIVLVETTDGFEMRFLAKELVVIAESQTDLMKQVSVKMTRKEEVSKPKSLGNLIKTKKNEFVFEVDLHIEKLVNSTKGMSNFDILNIQMDTAKRQLEFAINKRFPKVVFIHGVGEGVLKAELDFMLQKYSRISFVEASYTKYGMGATEINIRQNG